MKKIFLGMLVGMLILGTVPLLWLDLLPGERQDNRLALIKAWIAAGSHLVNINALSESREESRHIGKGLGLMGH